MGQIKYASFSERGVRSNNEDYIQSITDPVDDRYLFVVCDGMGGHDKGEVASQVVGSTICECWGNVSSDNDIVYVLRKAFRQASEALDVKADMLNHVEMGTTMVLAAIDGNKLTIAHAGDSRAYFLRHNDGMVYQTKDHLAHSVWGDSINRSFFSYQHEKADVEIHQFELQTGDRMFLCTDGVPTIIVPDIIARRSMADKSPEDVADIIQFFCEKFSKDNYSGILIFNE